MRFRPQSLVGLVLFGLGLLLTASRAEAQSQKLCLGAPLPPGWVITSIYFDPLTNCTPVGQITKRTLTIQQPPPTGGTPVCFQLMRNYIPNWQPPAGYLIRRSSYDSQCDPAQVPALDPPHNAWFLCEKDPAGNYCRIVQSSGGIVLASSASYNRLCFSPEQYVWGAAPDSLQSGFRSGTGSPPLALSDFSRTTPCGPNNLTLGDRNVVVYDKNGRQHSACILFINRDQVNFLMPPGVATDINPSPREGDGRGAWVTVRNRVDDKLISEGYVPVRKVQPSLFTADASGCGLPAAYLLRIRPDGSTPTENVAVRNPVTNQFDPVPIRLGPEGDVLYLVLYGTGIKLRANLNSVTVTFRSVSTSQEVTVPTQYAGAQGDYPGLDQLNVLLDRNIFQNLHGDFYVTVRVDDPEAKDKSTNRLRVRFE
jgi:uncharacterized protein (TIGR03437 family)